MSRLRCRLFGHGRFVCRLLYEDSTIHYGRGFRNDAGEALSWPECPRCGYRIIPTGPGLV